MCLQFSRCSTIHGKLVHTHLRHNKLSPLNAQQGARLQLQGESYNEDVSKTMRPKCSRAAGLSVPLSSPCKQRETLSRNT